MAKEREALVEKRGKTIVWKHYGFAESDLDQVTTVCKICYLGVAAPQSSTTNLFNHLKTSHKVVYDQAIKEQKEKALSTPSSTVTQSFVQDTLYN
ncbi:hypothetical protein ABVT39_012953, partial [Epinephelus coioides]